MPRHVRARVTHGRHGNAKPSRRRTIVRPFSAQYTGVELYMRTRTWAHGSAWRMPAPRARSGIPRLRTPQPSPLVFPCPPPFPGLVCSAFSPLEGFMNKEDYESVVQTMRLKNGALFGLPIVMDTNSEDVVVGERACPGVGGGGGGGGHGRPMHAA